MTVRYNRVLGIVFVALGALNLIIAIWAFLLTRNMPFSIFTAILLLILGAGYLRNPYFIVENDAIVAKALIGRNEKRFPYTRLWFDENVLMGEQSGTSRKMPVRRWLSNREDWAALVARVQQPRNR